jgi:hypothetical protein
MLGINRSPEPSFGKMALQVMKDWMVIFRRQ